MATATKNGSATTKNRIAKVETPKQDALAIKPIRRQHVSFRIRGISPYIAHNWDEKALRMMREKHAGRKTKEREVRDPQAEGAAAAYRTDEGKYGVPALAIKAACLEAAHKDLGIPKTIVSKAAFLICTDSRKILPLILDSDPIIQEDPVRVGQGSTDLRYRPYFYSWAVDVNFEIDAELLRVEDLIALVDRAGFGVGIGEWRPQTGGEYGRFSVDQTVPVVCEGA